jgi:hypothetical protein
MGAWTGDARLQGAPHNAKGFFENRQYKRLLQAHLESRGIYPDTRVGWQPIGAYAAPGFRADLEALLARAGCSGVAVLKNPLALYIADVIATSYPDSVRVCVHRNLVDVVKSQVRQYKVDPRKMSDYVIKAYDWLHKHCTHTVDADAIMRGEWQAVRDAVQDAGLVWSQERAEEFIDKELWHGTIPDSSVSG